MKDFFGKLFGTSDNTGTTTLQRPMNLSRATDTVRSYLSPQTTAEVIEEIHHSFYTAEDKLLAEAKAIIASVDETSFAKAERLAKLGFSNSTGVTAVQEQKQKLQMSKALQDTLLEYSLKYPTYRFIDEAGIKTICGKYNLVFGSIADYKGFVPEKNLAEIEKAPFKLTSVVEQRVYVFGSKPTRGWQDSSDSMRQHLAKTGYRSDNCVWEFRDRSELLICAPEKDMDMTGMTLEGHKVVKVHIPDPVVLKDMGNGLYCILTAWGDEASDPLVQKEGLN